MDAQIEKPQAVYVQVQDRKNRKFKTITVYGATHEEVMERIQSQFAGQDTGRKRDRR